MVILDKKENFIISTAAHFFGVENDLLLNSENSKALEKFLNVPNCRVVCVQRQNFKNDAELKFTNETIPHDVNRALIFFKLKSSSVTLDNFDELVQVTSTAKNPGSTLLESLHQVWKPTLKLSGITISSLQKIERDILGRQSPSTLIEEKNYWKEKYLQCNKSSEKKKIQNIIDILNNIDKELEDAAMSKDGLLGIEDVLEIISGFVDDLWKLDNFTYSEERMRELLDMIGNQLSSLIILFLQGLHSSESAVKDESLTNATAIYEKWVILCERLTHFFWPHHSFHPWQGPPFIPTKCAKMGNRLKETWNARLQYRQLTRLLTDVERSSLIVENLLESFNDFTIVLDDEKDIEWEKIKHQFEENLVPAEERVTEKLKNQLINVDSPIVLVDELQRYTELVKRKNIKEGLCSERHKLLTAVDDIIEVYQSGPNTDKLLDFPQILQEIQAALLAEKKLNILDKLLKELLDDLSGCKDAIDKVNLASKEVKVKRQKLVDSWIKNIQDSIAQKELILGINNSVVELIGTSMMKVNYDPRLVIINKEARALSGQGIELPREVKNLIERASILAGRARELQKIANFHNTIGDRMIPSQRPLMLSTAMEFARAVQEQSGVVWSDLYAIDNYINRLKKHTEKFARQNSELVAKHVYIHNLVANLLKREVVNLISSQSIWKDTLRSMRNLVDQVEATYGNTKAWKLHWDRQLLKVLDISYRAALPNLIKRLPEIHVDLVFRDNRLQWRPTLEEIRAKIYSAVRRFLSIPMNFRGVGDPADAKFEIIVKKNAHLFGGVYKEVEVAISTLDKVKIKWSVLAEPANVEIVERLKGKSPQEWEKAFKNTKQWAQQIGKLSGSEIKLWCLVVDTQTTRNDLESASRKYWDRLSSDLRGEASSRLMVIVDFLSAAAKEFDSRPNNVDEVGSAYEAHARIENESPKISEELIAVTGLAKVMAAWTREKLDGLSGVHAAWESLNERLERHKMMVVRQLEDAKINLQHRAVALNDERERWEARWSSKPDSITLEWVVSMRERWINLQEQKDTLFSDCQRVKVDVENILIEDSETLKRLEIELDIEESNCRFQNEFLKELEGQLSEEWSIVRKRLFKFHDWLDSWQERIKIQHRNLDTFRDIQIENTYIGKQILETRKNIELLQLLKGNELAEEHWNELSNILELSKDSKQLTFGDLLHCVPKICENIDKVKEISKRAVAESGIRQAILELETWETSTFLQLREFNDSKNNKIMLIEEYGQVLSRMGELKLLLEGAKSAAGYERFAARAGRCESALFELEERIKLLGLIQRKWVYLEPVYCGGAAPNDNGKWSRADKEFRYLLGEIIKDSKILSLRRIGFSVLHNLKDSLDRCQKSLDDFLEEKRSAYPRLYFLNDEDLLELISSTEMGLKNHLPKLYHGIGSIQLDSGLLKSIISPEGETLNFVSTINILDPLPVWLMNLEEMIKVTLSQSLDDCLNDENPDVAVYPLQVLLLYEQILFTEQCEEAIQGGRTNLNNFLHLLKNKKIKYRDMEDAADSLLALKARSLLLDTVHHLNIVRDLIKALETYGNTSWTWNGQLRCYRTKQGPIIKCAGAEFHYGFEYQGAAIGLVRTCLTEKCFLALTQAMKLGLGGSPTGPAGTGKTESVKALASILGRLVLVFNCDEGMDATSMQRILGGLARAGAWGCFDEFNRLEEKTLSAVAMLIRPLQQALRDNLAHVQINGENIRLNPHCCIFITMNPAGDDYGSRNKLPDSLARLFRPIAMAHPDRYDIAKALLECAGFLDATTLANQLIETLDICDKLLSKQSHYDWGLRALRSILDAIPSLSNASKSTEESAIILQAITSSLLSKLTKEDTEKFNELLKDIFPNVTWYDLIDKQELRKVLIDITHSKNLKEDVIYRCEQLYDQLKSRTGIAIVGPPGTGKSLIRKILFEALTKMGNNLKEVSIFSGAVLRSQLLGFVDLHTREWKEGLISSVLGSVGWEKPLWIVLNGDVEPSWVEALNSALDDNRLLTLPNGIGIKLGPHVRFIFETHELAKASPATVSRLGVIYLGTTTISHLLTCLPVNIADSFSITVKAIFDNQLPIIIDQFLKMNENISISHLIKTLLPHFQCSSTLNSLTYALLMALCFQIQHPDNQQKLATFIYQSVDSWCPDLQKPLDIFYNQDIDRLEPFHIDNSIIQTKNGPVLVTNILKRGLMTILPWIKSGHPVLVRALAGSGKSSLISLVLHHLKDDMESLNIVYASYVFGTRDLVNRLKKLCIKVESSLVGRIYRPKSGQKIILIVEDVHLASKSLQELLRQIIEENGFYEEDLVFASLPVSLLLTADEITELHPRLSSLTATHYLHPPTLDDKQSITTLHLQEALPILHYNQTPDFESWISHLASVMQESLLTASSQNKNFSWNVRDLSLWANNLIKYPAGDNCEIIIKYVLDIGIKLFYSKFTSKTQLHWGKFLTSKFPDINKLPNNIYVWQNGNSSLTLLTFESWKEEITKVVEKCVREGEQIETVVYPHLLKLTASLSWAFGCEYRGIILVGRPGAGRRSSVRLAASFSSLKLINFGPGRGKVSVKAAIQSAGIDGEPTLLLLEEYHMQENDLVNLAGAIVSRGEVPGLLSPEELDGLIAPLIDIAQKQDFSEPLDQFFYHRLRNLLWIVVILDSTEMYNSEIKQSNLLKNSILISDVPGNEWWAVESSLIDTANIIVNKGNPPSESITPVLKYLIEVHMQTSHHEKSPARFIALLQTWRELRELWIQNIESQISTLEAGVDKLKEAGNRVAKLENDVSEQRKQLEMERGRADVALEQITATMRGATGQRGEMTNLKADTERESIELGKRKEIIEGELSKVTPLVEAAAQAVAGINSDALSEVRSLRAPPAAVRDVLEGVLRLMGIKDTSWNSMKTFLAKRGIKDEIRNWDARRSTPTSLEAVAKLVKERSESFDEKTARRASVAAAPLASWVLANLQYGQIIQQVAPLEREQRMLAEKLAVADAQIGKLAEGLNSVEFKVKELQKELAERSQGAAALQLRSEATQASLQIARALLDKLDVEYEDWQKQLENLKDRKKRLDLEAAKAAAFLIYPNIEKDDKKKKSTIELLITERERLIWRAQSLPEDTGSLIGAICARRSPLVCFFIDPSGVAVTWLKANLENQLEITKPEDHKFLTILELAVRFGKSLLIEEIVQFPSIILPLLRKQPLRVGDRILPIQQGFKLFLATRKDNMDSIPSEANAVLLKITLGTDKKSLAERFIQKALSQDNPELEKERREALELEEKLSGEQDAARLDLLAQLASARGQDLLQESNINSSQEGQPSTLLTSLETTQTKAKEIARILMLSRQSRENITKREKEYEKLAKFAANLFQTIKSLVTLSPLYVFSIDAFTDIYLEAELFRSQLVNVDKNIAESQIEKKLVSLTLDYCMKAALRKHRLPLALYLTLTLYPVPDIERNLLLQNNTDFAMKKSENTDDINKFIMPNWVPEERKMSIKMLTTAIPEIGSKLTVDWIDDLKNIYKDQSLSSLQKVLVIQALRPDYFHSALTKLVRDQLGVKKLSPDSWTLESLIESNKIRPILFLLSPGADPGPEINALALRFGIPGHFVEISLGQDRVEQAEIALDNACKNGDWVLLSNLQLALNWLPRLERILRSPQCNQNKNPATRIWLTTEECNKFYSGLAGICLKMAYEPPEGVKRNLKKSLRQLRNYRSQSKSSESTFVLAWLHAILQERRRFIPHGWIRSYEWNEADLEAARELVIDYALKFNPEGRLDWEEGQGLLDVAIYGGRLQDKYDMRVLNALIQDIWSEEVFQGRKKLGNRISVPEMNKKEHLKMIEQLPDDEPPVEFFGLPANALRAWERSAAETTINALEEIFSKSMKNINGGLVKGNNDKIQQHIINYLKQQNLRSYLIQNFQCQNSTSIGQFFNDETHLFEKLILVIIDNVEKFQIFDSKTPSDLLKYWPSGSRELTTFINELKLKSKFLSSVDFNFKSEQSINLAYLSRPQAFLAALKQHTAREMNYPLHELNLKTYWIQNIEDRMDEKEMKVSITISGLFMSGAKIKNGFLHELTANSPSVISAPQCKIAFVHQQTAGSYYNDDESFIDIPLYDDSKRNRLICTLAVGCSKNSRNDWLKRVCRKKYSVSSNKAKFPSTDEPDEASISSSSDEPLLCPNDFDFCELCLFCGKKWNPANIKVYLVTYHHIKRRLMITAEKRKDETGEIVKQRLQGIHSLVDVKARYHRKCYGDFIDIRLRKLSKDPNDL